MIVFGYGFLVGVIDNTPSLGNASLNPALGAICQAIH